MRGDELLTIANRTSKLFKQNFNQLAETCLERPQKLVQSVERVGSILTISGRIFRLL